MMSCQSDLHWYDSRGEKNVHGEGYTCADCGFPAAELQGVILNIAHVCACVIVTGLILVCFRAYMRLLLDLPLSLAQRRPPYLISGMSGYGQQTQ